MGIAIRGITGLIGLIAAFVAGPVLASPFFPLSEVPSDMSRQDFERAFPSAIFNTFCRDGKAAPGTDIDCRFYEIKDMMFDDLVLSGFVLLTPSQTVRSFRLTDRPYQEVLITNSLSDAEMAKRIVAFGNIYGAMVRSYGQPDRPCIPRSSDAGRNDALCVWTSNRRKATLSSNYVKSLFGNAWSGKIDLRIEFTAVH